MTRLSRYIAIVAAALMVFLPMSEAEAQPIRVSFRTASSHYIIAADASVGFNVAANADGVGPWEEFTIVPRSGYYTSSVSSGDDVYLMTRHGRYVTAANAGGGEVVASATVPDAWETFKIERTAGPGAIQNGDNVTLRTNNGRNFLMAVNGGGGALTAASTQRSVWETFRIEIRNTQSVRLRTYTGQYVAAANGGGGNFTAYNTAPQAYETLTLVNRTRSSGFRAGAPNMA